MAENHVAHTVLIVDDTPECIRLLMETLRGDYAVIVATSGEKALQLAAKSPHPDIILLDIRMPDLDGFEVCRRLKEDGRLATIPVVFLSQLDDTGDKVTAFQAGGVDYITKPFQFEEVRARVDIHLKLRRAQLELERKRQELQAAYDQLDRELRCVGEVQASLLPARLPDIAGFQASSYYRPARRAGGDYYNCFRIDDDRWGIFLADVSGHGPPAAVVTAMTHVMLNLAPEKSETDSLLRFLNDHLYACTGDDQFVTAFYGVLEPRTRFLTFSVAGHPPPLLFRRGSASISLCAAENGIPLGINPGEAYPAAMLCFEPGDTLVCYTDGITETETAANEMYGIDGLRTLLGGYDCGDASCLVEKLCRSIEQFRGNADQADDITLLVFIAGDDTPALS